MMATATAIAIAAATTPTPYLHQSALQFVDPLSPPHGMWLMEMSFKVQRKCKYVYGISGCQKLIGKYTQFIMDYNIK
jgi:hypothetical protein